VSVAPPMRLSQSSTIDGVRARRMLVLVTALAASALVQPVAPGAAIVPQVGIAGVKLGMSQGKVRSTLGKPTRVQRGTNEFGAYTELTYAGLRVSFQGNSAVTNIRTTRRTERTGSGVGPGSTEAQVRAKVTGVRCKTEFGLRHCWVGRFLAGRRVTDFRIKKGRVTTVDVGIVID
jgi:hypothetical protein